MHYSNWCQKYNYDPLNINEDKFADYILQMGESLTVATIQRRVASLSSIFNLTKNTNPTKEPVVLLTWKLIWTLLRMLASRATATYALSHVLGTTHMLQLPQWHLLLSNIDNTVVIKRPCTSVQGLFYCYSTSTALLTHKIKPLYHSRKFFYNSFQVVRESRNRLFQTQKHSNYYFYY